MIKLWACEMELGFNNGGWKEIEKKIKGEEKGVVVGKREGRREKNSSDWCHMSHSH